uniref:delta-60 repeat domain-containing protein n=1 Tax=Nocardioides sp. TaxID=35761 RepID=UPI002B278387
RSINDYGTVMPTVLMAAPGTLDTTFTDPNLNSPAYGVAVLAGGKILATGNFTAAGSDNTPHGRIARFNPDGTPDPDFGDPNLKSANAYASAQRVAIQDDGGILVTGDFITAGAGDDAYRFLARLGPDGGVDYSFRNPDIDGGDGGPTVGTGRGVAVQADGKVVVAGYFAAVGPESNPTPGSSERTPYGNLARFNADGTLDTTFINPHLDQFAHAVVIQPDGKILVAGSFTHVGAAAIPCQGLARFNPDGTPDPTFEDPQLGNNISGAGSCRALALQDDGKILVTGNFTTAGADNRPYRWLARINSDGTPDPTFENPDLDDGGEGGATGWGVAVQSDGRILVVGGFDTAAGQPRNGLARYHSNGSLDGGFANPNLTAAGAVAVQADGQILVCGNFTTAGTGNTPYRHLARFHG